jgi:hypothetical protein
MSAARAAIGMHATEARAAGRRRVATAPVAKAGRVASAGIANTAPSTPAAKSALLPLIFMTISLTRRTHWAALR